jgi:hypothetical protein
MAVPNLANISDIVNGQQDILSMIIRSHQAIEAVLNAAISEALPNAHALEVERISFALKADLAAALQIVRMESLPSLQRFNTLRNRFAHRVDASFEANDATDLLNTLSTHQRYVAKDIPDPASDPKRVLAVAIAVMFCEIEVVLERIKDQKLADETWHEMVVDLLKDSPVQLEDSPHRQKVHRDFKRRFEEKKRSQT